MMKQIYKISAPKDNGGLPRRLVIVVPKKKGIISKIET